MLNTIGIIGGSGQMGSIFAFRFREQGYRVLVTSNDSGQEYEDLLARSDMVIVSVPIEKSALVVRKIASKLRPDQILSDFTSVKKDVLNEMQKSQSAIISAHPMFGKMENIEKQKILLLPVREKGLLAEVEKVYRKLGLSIFVMKDWQNHDKYMSVIQGLMHFLQINFVKILRSSNLDLNTLISICSPVYHIAIAMACRILTRDVGLYTHILMDNLENREVILNFLKGAEANFEWIEQKKESEFREDFLNSRNFLGDYGVSLDKLSQHLVELIQKESSNQNDE